MRVSATQRRLAAIQKKKKYNVPKILALMEKVVEASGE
jgi:hypothetical protein